MGQSTTPPFANSLQVCSNLFLTPLGWWGIVGSGVKVARSYCGFPTQAQLQEKIERDFCDSTLQETDWYPELRRRLETYARSGVGDFTDIELAYPKLTVFQKKVLQQTRKIRSGKTLTYGELAERAGFPRAARAVGSVMASNRFPIIIPCHRVIGACGKLVGYTNPVGLPFKERLLMLESAD